MEPKGTFFTASDYDSTMPYEIELVFEDRVLHKLLRGKFKVNRGQLTVTAIDGRQKIAQVDRNNPELMARSMLHDMELEKLH
jgi:hypothetical protein